MHYHTVPAVLLLWLSPLLPAQFDMIGITFTGQAVEFDSHTGAGALLGPTGSPSALSGHNATARLVNDLFTTDRTPVAAGFQHHLDRLDKTTGHCTRIFNNVGDLRGLAAHPSVANTLCGILDGTGDRLVSISVATGVVTVVGATGFAGIQALGERGGQLLAWDITAGLLRINPNTGVATDVNPNVGTNGAPIQFLATHTDGRLLGGQRELYRIDPATGVPTLIASIAQGAFDLRGAEERVSFRQNFGTGCASVTAGNCVLTVSGTAPGGFLTASSGGHLAGRLGVLVLGFDNRATQGQTLPFLLDGLLGTVGCTLYTSIDVTRFGTVNASGFCNHALTLPTASAGLTLFAQHAILEPTLPGGMTWSDGVMVRIGF